jgi:hypothetical protein
MSRGDGRRWFWAISLSAAKMLESDEQSPLGVDATMHYLPTG